MNAIIARCLSGAAKARVEYRKAIACDEARRAKWMLIEHASCMQHIADLRKIEADANLYDAAFKAFSAAIELYAIDKSDESLAMIKHCDGVMGATLKAWVERKVSRDREADRRRADYEQRLVCKVREKRNLADRVANIRWCRKHPLA